MKITKEFTESSLNVGRNDYEAIRAMRKGIMLTQSDLDHFEFSSKLATYRILKDLTG